MILSPLSLANETPEEMIFSEKKARYIGQMITQAQKIAIISHRNPDGDTSGSGLALRDVLLRQGKYVLNVCGDQLPSAFQFLPDASCYVDNFDPSYFDLIITVDAATKAQTGFHEKLPGLFSGNIPLINIDHHISNELFGTLNLVVSDACSTAAVMWNIFDILDWRISPDAATCLLNGVMTDTGSFQHSNTTPQALRIGSKLLAAGASLHKIRSHVFKSTTVPTLKLWGKILNRLEMGPDKIAVSLVKEEDFKKTGADPKDTSGAIDYLNMIPEAKYAMLLTERKGRVKGSLRTQREDVNVSEIAGRFGGGGHVKAAGFNMNGSLQIEKRFTIVPE